MDAKKIDDYSIEITKQAPMPDPIKVTYERAFIEQQIKNITEQRDSLIALKESELKECTDILKEMDAQGIVVKPVEVKPIEEVK
jgi:DNA polymerase III alpha subunit (gram-positive type)